MIKKILIISLLTVSLLFSSFYFYKKRAEAVVPIAVYVAVSALIHFAVGAYIYYQSQSGGDDEAHKITNINQSTGEIQIEFVDNIEGTLVNSIPVFDVPGNSGVGCPGANGYVAGYWSWDVGQREAVRANLIRIQCDEANGGSSLFCTISESIDVFPDWNQWTLKRHYASCIDQGESLDQFSYDINGGVLGGSYSTTIDGEPVEMYEFLEDVPNYPTCFDGIQNQDETGIDCGGVCELNFGFTCYEPPPETCFDGIMNQDETGIDYGGVCGTGDIVSAPSGNFVDENQDGIDDISGFTETGAIPVADTVSNTSLAGVPTADENTYDTSLPGNVSEVGETNWTGLITGYLAANPLVVLAGGNQINLSGSQCLIVGNVLGGSFTIDFCSLESMINLIGTFVLGLCAIRAVFIALGV